MMHGKVFCHPFGRCTLLCILGSILYSIVNDHFLDFLGGDGIGACLLSSFLLLRIRYVRYCIVYWCMFFMRPLVTGLGMLMFLSLFMEC